MEERYTDRRPPGCGGATRCLHGFGLQLWFACMRACGKEGGRDGGREGKLLEVRKVEVENRRAGGDCLHTAHTLAGLRLKLCLGRREGGREGGEAGE